MQTIAIRIIVLWFWLYDLIWLKKSYVVLVKDNHFFIPNFPFEVEDFEPTITPSLHHLLFSKFVKNGDAEQLKREIN